MPNRNVFATRAKAKARAATGKTSEGNRAYSLHPEQTLAELACVGTFRGSFYNEAMVQLNTLLSMGAEVDDEFLAQLALYSRHEGKMKDMPAAFMALLSTRDPKMFRKVFPRVIDNPRMLRGFVQIMRSGAIGRTSLGKAPKRMIQACIQSWKDFMLFNGQAGNDPSLADIIKMVHPKPTGNEWMTPRQMNAAFAYIIGKEYDGGSLPKIFKEYEAFKAGRMDEVPRVNFRFIDGLDNMTDEHWRQLGYSMNWTTARMNLNTLLRHGALDDENLVKHLARLLSDEEKIERSKCFPYQILTAYKSVSENLPMELQEALQDALEASVGNVPMMPGRVLVTVDISGSMTWPVTGYCGYGYGYGRKPASATTCMDVAALFGAAILRKNKTAKLTAFSERLYHRRFNPRDSIPTIASKLLGSGSHSTTNWDAAIAWALEEREKFDAIIWVSDMEANIDTVRYGRDYGYYTGATSAASHIKEYRAKVNKNLKVITMNVTANEGHSQVDGEFDPNVLQISGFSDAVFDVIAGYLEAPEPGYWVKKIKEIEI